MNFKEYKERREAQKFFRQNNDLYLSKEQWLKTIVSTLVSAIVIGVIYGLLSIYLSFGLNMLTIVVGYAIANIVVSSSGVQSQQMGILSAIMTLLTYYFSIVFILFYTLGQMSTASLVYIIPVSFTYLLHSSIIDIIFMVIGMFVSYTQAQ